MEISWQLWNMLTISVRVQQAGAQKKQQVIALLTVKAKYIAQAHAAK